MHCLNTCNDFNHAIVPIYFHRGACQLQLWRQRRQETRKRRVEIVLVEEIMLGTDVHVDGADRWLGYSIPSEVTGAKG